MKSLPEFIDSQQLTCKVKRVDRNPHMDDMPQGSSHWLVTIKRDRFSIRVPFSQGPAITNPPTLGDVLDCLASDASVFENASDFSDWRSEYGYSDDSRKAERIYKVVAKQAAQLRAMLGQEAYESLLWNTECA